MLCALSRLGSFVVGMMVHQSIDRLLIYISKMLFVHGHVIFQQGKGEQKHITKKVIKFPNQSTLLTLFWAIVKT